MEKFIFSQRFLKIQIFILVALGVALPVVKWTRPHSENFQKFFHTLNVSPLVEPFLGYSFYDSVRDRFHFRIHYFSGQVFEGDHFERIYQIGGLHIQRVALINEARMAGTEVASITDNLRNFYCTPSPALGNVEYFELFKTRWNCAIAGSNPVEKNDKSKMPN